MTRGWQQVQEFRRWARGLGRWGWLGILWCALPALAAAAERTGPTGPTSPTTPTGSTAAASGERLRVGTWNLENYLLQAIESRPAKSEAAKAKIATVLKDLNADILALQELGGVEAAEDVRTRVRRLGLDYLYWEIVHGVDPHIQVAVFSRYPFTARRAHTNDTYLLSGRRLRVSRGILEVEVRVGDRYSLTVFTTHLKSRRAVPEADEGEMRREEARILRGKIEDRMKREPRANVVVLGDFNDSKDSEAIRTLIGKGAGRLVDTRPAEVNGDSGVSPRPRWQPRTVTWTHYYGVEDSYNRIDYALLNANAAREWVPAESRIFAVPDWGLASDHRPLLVVLGARDR